jgi:kynurenine formamidase
VGLTPELRELAARVSNWGRWGDDDEIGTLNLIDAAAAQRAAAAVRTGEPISLAIKLDQNGPQVGGIPGRVNPLHAMVAINQSYTGGEGDICFNDDVATLGLQSCTHWDALSHASYDGKLYNGFDANTVTAAGGAARCGIHRVRSLVTRGVLLDVARAKGVDRLDGGYGITAADLEAARELAGVDIAPGDALLVRTGHMQIFKARDRQRYTTGDQPGLTTGAIPWLRDHDVAAVATDTLTLEVFPCEDPGVFFPVHMIQLRDMGLTQGQNFDLEALAVACAADGRYDFLLAANPEPFTGGTGSPVNPVAVR